MCGKFVIKSEKYKIEKKYSHVLTIALLTIAQLNSATWENKKMILMSAN